MDTNSSNEEPCIVVGASRIIYVKECNKESPKNQVSYNNNRSDETKDERISINPVDLEDIVSCRSNHSKDSVPNNGSNEIPQDVSIGEIFVEIINRNSVQFIGVVSLCVLSFLSLTLIPYHNVILCPFYWYEPIFIHTLGAIPCCVGVFIIQVKMILDYQDIIKFTIIFKLSLQWAVLLALVHSLVHLSWSFGFGYNSPIPFSMVIDFYFTVIASCLVLYYLFPKDFRSTETFPGRFKGYICYMLYASTVPLQITIVNDSVKELSNVVGYNIKWTIAILLYFIKKKSISVLGKYLTKVALSDNTSVAKRLVTIENGCMFKSFTLILIGSKADAITGYSFLGISILFNIKACADIIQLHRASTRDANNIDTSRNRKQELLTTLMLNETQDFFISIAYMLSISIAYHGPNAGIIGNVQNDYWQYHAIDSFSNYLSGMFYSILIDISCGVVTLVALRYFCSINGLLFFKDKIGQFAYMIVFCVSREMNLVSNPFSFIVS